MPTILIGLDDTDNQTSPGTGSLARSLCTEFQKHGMTPAGITRHQFLLDPAIAYTSHNSGACIAVETDQGIDALSFAFEFVARRSAPGSDPGLCIAQTEAVSPAVIQFANAAVLRVLQMKDAFSLALASSIRLHGLGGLCSGVIGALAAVGLRAEGASGRFIDLPGLRELSGRVNAADFTNLAIAIKHRIDDRPPLPTDLYDTMNWVRPNLVNGRPVLTVEWSEQTDAWIPVDRKKDRPLE
ncbi:MAG: hypothetical protein JSU94_09815 [Phycisphaerales bacterium]|nr:MAG: hypothetical protein JSU94_09815 [Phycisphaerales bacterium]